MFTRLVLRSNMSIVEDTKYESLNTSISMFRNPFSQLHYQTPLLAERDDPDWTALYPLCPDVERLKMGFLNAVGLSVFAYNTFVYGKPRTVKPAYAQSFQRYFQPGQEDEVAGIFLSVTIYPKQTIGGDNAVGSSHFDAMQVFYIDWNPPTLQSRCFQILPNGRVRRAYFTQNVPQPTAHYGEVGGLLVVCPALLSINAQGGHTWPDLSGVNCQGFGNPPRASQANIDNVASILLHEFLHFNYLFDHDPAEWYIQDWNALDYPGQNPTHGYGPVNSHIIDQLYARGQGPILPSPDSPNPLYNSDNYIYYALETYFQDQCGLAGWTDP